jgi:undecaprenyl pyrophosphate phosphatase UppP
LLINEQKKKIRNHRKMIFQNIIFTIFLALLGFTIHSLNWNSHPQCVKSLCMIRGVWKIWKERRVFKMKENDLGK